MKTKWFAPAVLALSLGTSGLISTNAYAAPQGPPPGYRQGPGGWDAPPPGFRDAQRRGFQDGIEGARKDFGNHRRPDVNNRDEFRHPRVPGPMRADYREGFRRGYDVAMRHLMEGGSRHY